MGLATDKIEDVKRIDQIELDGSNHRADVANPHGVTKSQVGLDQVDNKNSATLQTEILAAADKTDVGLDQVDNTADLDKPVSVAQQTAVDGATGNALAFAIALG